MFEIISVLLGLLLIGWGIGEAREAFKQVTGPEIQIISGPIPGINAPFIRYWETIICPDLECSGRVLY